MFIRYYQQNYVYNILESFITFYCVTHPVNDKLGLIYYIESDLHNLGIAQSETSSSDVRRDHVFKISQRVRNFKVRNISATVTYYYATEDINLLKTSLCM